MNMNEKEFNQHVIDLVMENLVEDSIDGFLCVQTFEEACYLTKDIGFVMTFRDSQYHVRVTKTK